MTNWKSSEKANDDVKSEIVQFETNISFSISGRYFILFRDFFFAPTSFTEVGKYFLS